MNEEIQINFSEFMKQLLSGEIPPSFGRKINGLVGRFQSRKIAYEQYQEELKILFEKYRAGDFKIRRKKKSDNS